MRVKKSTIKMILQIIIKYITSLVGTHKTLIKKMLKLSDFKLLIRIIFWVRIYLVVIFSNLTQKIKEMVRTQ